jgi:predicted TIM-barrel fold metal-dependent hydrolase
MRQLWRLATEQELSLCPLVSAEFLPSLEPMLSEFSKIDIVIDHFGHVDVTKPKELETLLVLAKHRRVHVKASGFYKFGDKQAPYPDLTDLMRKVVNAFGPERILWGSDCPYQLQNGNNYHDAVELIKTGLDFLDATACMAILRDNAQRLFFR